MTVHTHTAFFYGTLIHPAILRRVIGHEGPELQIAPALLLDYTRHRIKHADYPGIVPYEKSKSIFRRDLSREENSVRGTLVTGLTDQDVEHLDVFEGDEYSRDTVSVYPLSSFTPLSDTSPHHTRDSNIVPSSTPSLPSLDTLPPPLSAQTYVWIDPVAHLEPAIWEYSDFVRDSAWRWVGDNAEGREEYVEVDKRREMNGKIERTEIVSGEAEGERNVVVETEDA